jgi:hypothetical protein
LGDGIGLNYAAQNEAVAKLIEGMAASRNQLRSSPD